MLKTALVEFCHKIDNLSLEQQYTVKVTLVYMQELFQKKTTLKKWSCHIQNSLSGQTFYVTQDKKLENSWARYCKTKKPIETSVFESFKVAYLPLIDRAVDNLLQALESSVKLHNDTLCEDWFTLTKGLSWKRRSLSHFTVAKLRCSLLSPKQSADTCCRDSTQGWTRGFANQILRKTLTQRSP